MGKDKGEVASERLESAAEEPCTPKDMPGQSCQQRQRDLTICLAAWWRAKWRLNLLERAHHLTSGARWERALLAACNTRREEGYKLRYIVSEAPENNPSLLLHKSTSLALTLATSRSSSSR